MMHMVTRLSRKVVVVMVFRNDWAAEGRQTALKRGAKSVVTATVDTLCLLTLGLGVAVHLQVGGGQTELVPVLSGQVVLLQAAAHAEAAPHRGHLVVKLLPCDFVVKAQPAELNLDAEGAEEERGRAATSVSALSLRNDGGGLLKKIVAYLRVIHVLRPGEWF